MNDATLAEQVRELVDVVEPMTMDEIQSPRVAQSSLHRSAIGIAFAVMLLAVLFAAGLVALLLSGGGNHSVQARPTPGGGREVKPRDFSPAAPTFNILMDHAASENDLDAVRTALRASHRVAQFSVFDTRTIRRMAGRLFNADASAAPSLGRPAPFIALEVTVPISDAWVDALEALPGVSRVSLSANASDPLGSYAECVADHAAGWQAQADVPTGTPPEEVAALRVTLEGNPLFSNVEFLDAAASYEQAVRVWRNNPAANSSVNYPASFRFSYDRSQHDAVKAAVVSLGLKPVETWHGRGGELTTFACSAYDNYR